MTTPTDEPPASDVVLVLTLRDGGLAEVWQREGRPATEFAAVLRQVADDFDNGDVRRVE